jgi:hypothetical protein
MLYVLDVSLLAEVQQNWLERLNVHFIYFFIIEEIE